MRKIVTLILILSIASMASATVTLVQSSITIVENTTGILQVTSDDTNGWTGYVGSARPTDEITAVATAAAGGDSSVTAEAGYPGEYKIITKDASSPFTIVSGVQWNVTVGDGGLTDGNSYTFILYDNDYTSQLDTATVYIIPEPATIALLGLGGLLLRKRKK